MSEKDKSEEKVPANPLLEDLLKDYFQVFGEEPESHFKDELEKYIHKEKISEDKYGDKDKRLEIIFRAIYGLPLSEILLEEYYAIHGKDKQDELQKELNEHAFKEEYFPKPGDSSDEKQEKEKKRLKNEDERLKIIFEAIHNLQKDNKGRSALCLSGGGIRSATFCLGVIQGMARKNLLDKFDYLSTVSGGGYIGGWLTAWIKRNGSDEVYTKLELYEKVKGNTADNPDKLKTAPEPKEITHLRAYSNLLTPKVGLLSVDTWTLIAIYLRNLFLNWLVLVPFVLAVLLIPRIYASLINKNFGIAWLNTNYDVLSSFILGLGLIFGALALAYISSNRPSIRGFKDKDEPVNFKRNFLCPLLISVFLLTIGRAWIIKTEFTFGYLPSLTDFGYWDWWNYTLGGFGLMFLAGLFFVVYLLLENGFYFFINNKKKRFLELIVLLLTGALGGFCLWLLSLPEKISTILNCSSVFGEIRCTNNLELNAWLDGPRLILVFLFMGIISNGIGSRWWIDDDDREWWARTAAFVLRLVVIWIGVYALVIWIPINLKTDATLSIPLGLIGSIAGFVTILFAISPKTPANDRQAEKAGRLTTILDYGVKFAAPIFTAFLIVFLSFFTDFLIVLIRFLLYNYTKPVSRWESPFNDLAEPSNLNYNELINAIHSGTPFSFLIIMFIVLLAISYLMAKVININQFSLHSLYRNRLIRTYLGASRERKPNAFTDFDQDDDLKMSKLKNESGETLKPFHIVNMTWNLVNVTKLQWQNRKATTFTVSPLHCGNYSSGYRRSDEYGGEDSKSISLGTALTISGAAASPNMGYYSSTFVTFLMTLFNARLGWWLGNPRKEKYKKPGPKSALLPMINEASGKTEEDKDYIYLSDGGHFENLGLYEMVLRRCHYIFVVDASRDPDYKFENLGNAIRRIRVDLGVNIEIENYPRKQANPSPYCAIGKICYTEIDSGATDGILIYIKPSLIGNEPTDIFNYAQDNIKFPHEPTSDLWFSEQQFESYRTLGYYAIDQIFERPLKEKNLSNLERVVRDYIKEAEKGTNQTQLVKSRKLMGKTKRAWFSFIGKPRIKR